MRWLVEITDITDKRLLSDLLDKGKDRLFPEEDRFYLISSDFESLSICCKVWENANEIRSIISEISAGLDAGVSFKLGTVYEQKEDGSRHGTVFRSGVAPVLRLFANGAGRSVTPEISEEEKLRLEAERLEHKYQEKLALVSSRLLPALQDERPLKVYRLLQQELTPLRMGHIMDLIEADCGGTRGELKDFISGSSFIKGKDLIDSFYFTINYSEALGENARHMVNKRKNKPQKEQKNKPPNLMSLSDAQAFVLRVADLWFKQKCFDSNNA